MWRIVYLNDRYGIMNLLTEESWAGQPRAMGSYLRRNETLHNLMSAADTCICEALDELDSNV